jgi:hypothetical protein
LKRCILSIDFIDANPHTQLRARGLQKGKVHYFHDNNPNQWITEIPTYQEVVYSHLWPYIDLVYRGTEGKLKYDLIIHPGGEVQHIQWTVDGAKNLTLDEEGNLQIHTELGMLMEKRPVSFQEVNGERREVKSRFALTPYGRKKKVSMEVQTYDSRFPLIIDPPVLSIPLILEEVRPILVLVLPSTRKEIPAKCKMVDLLFSVVSLLSSIFSMLVLRLWTLLRIFLSTVCPVRIRHEMKIDFRKPEYLA